MLCSWRPTAGSSCEKAGTTVAGWLALAASTASLRQARSCMPSAGSVSCRVRRLRQLHRISLSKSSVDRQDIQQWADSQGQRPQAVAAGMPADALALSSTCSTRPLHPRTPARPRCPPQSRRGGTCAAEGARLQGRPHAPPAAQDSLPENVRGLSRRYLPDSADLSPHMGLALAQHSWHMGMSQETPQGTASAQRPCTLCRVGQHLKADRGDAGDDGRQRVQHAAGRLPQQLAQSQRMQLALGLAGDDVPPAWQLTVGVLPAAKQRRTACNLAMRAWG